MFIDYAKIFVKAGDGGDGAVSFRREKFVPKGGPAGGNGGNGGNIIFRADNNMHTLLDFNYKKKYNAKNGQPGMGALKDGKTGEDIIIKVPVGTLIKDAESGNVIFDLNESGIEFIAAKGGRGGKGNSNFATSTNQTPRYAEDGKPGEERQVILELKLIADIGLVGLPNAGKSTFISVVSAARPKIADYPFTTLQPNLGIVNYRDYQSFVVADIPGIIEGAHEGKGLGLRFLRHIERTKILLLLIDITEEDHQKTYEALVSELANYSPDLANKKKLLAFSKADLLPEDELKKIAKKKIRGYDGKPIIFSSASKIGLNDLLDQLWKMLND
ncbi:MAG: GTPase ObgE [Melioribacteraceae bacterium]|nr:GTPase ObgE [Melioribacteraceae bacterium]MCF8354781.1 GTPase ObgE [Melioribacteraceae bacterium]MCF8393325.1 GTPase ObgE [Melioribacteraceae bacterium]MCF8419177.1 GTPase ObgE [Melioribacteraceae bacterium]